MIYLLDTNMLIYLIKNQPPDIHHWDRGDHCQAASNGPCALMRGISGKVGVSQSVM